MWYRYFKMGYQSACNCHLEFLSVTDIPITLHPYTMKYVLVVQKL
jgi:hypothetical protein